MADPKIDAFTEYVKRRQSEQPSTQYGLKLTGPAPSATVESGTTEGNRRGWLGTFFDFLNMGVYAQTNTANQLLDLPQEIDDIKTKWASGDKAGAVGDAFGSVTDIVNAPIKGLTTPVRRLLGQEIKPGEDDTFEAVIERTADVANRNNPNYVNFKDNVNPTFKGALGLVGDIAADPLTWVTAGTVSTAKTAARGSAVAAKDAAKAAEKAGELTPVGKAAEGGIDNLPAATLDARVKQVAEEAAQTGGDVSSEILKQLRRDINRPVIDGKKQTLQGGLRDFVRDLKTPPKKPIIEPSKVLDTKQYFKLLQSELPQIQNLKIADILPGFNQFDVIPGVVGGTRIAPTLGKALQQFEKGTKEVKDAVAKRVLGPLYKRYNSRAEAGEAITALGTPKTASEALRSAEELSVSQIVAQNLRTLSQARQERGVALFGAEDFARLQAMGEEDLAKYLDDINIIIRGSMPLDNIAQLSQNPNAMSLLRQFRYDDAAHDAARLDLEARVETVPAKTPETIQENIENISEIADVRQALDDAIDRYGLAQYGNREEIGQALLETLDAGKVAWLKNFSEDFRKLNDYEFFTKYGVPRTKDMLGEGTAVIPNTVNGMAQFDLMYNMGKFTNKFFEGGGATLAAFKGLKGYTRAAAKEKFDLAAIRMQEAFMDKNFIPVYMNARAFEGGSEIVKSLKMSEVYDTVKAVMVGDVAGGGMGLAQKWMRMGFFNAGTGVSIIKFMEAVVVGMKTGDKAKVLEILTSLSKPHGGTMKPKSNWLAGGEKWARFGAQKNKGSIEPGTKAGKVLNKEKKILETLYSNKQLAEYLAEAIIRAVPKLEQIHLETSAKFAALGRAESDVLTDGAAKIIVDAINDSANVARGVRILDESGQVVKDVQRAIGPMTPIGPAIANAKVSGGIGKGVKGSAHTTARVADAVATGDPKKIAKAKSDSARQTEEMLEGHEKATNQVVKDISEGRTTVKPSAQRMADNEVAAAAEHVTDPIKSIAQRGSGFIRASVAKAFDPINRIFNSRRGMNAEEQLWVSQLFRGTENLQGWLQGLYLGPIAQLGKKYNKLLGSKDKARTELQQAYNNLVSGVKPTTEIEKDLAQYVGRILPIGDAINDPILGNIFFRTAASIKRVNEILKQRRVLDTTSGEAVSLPEEFFDIGAVYEKLGANASQKEIMEELALQFRSWDVKDPIQFLDRMYRAATQLAAEAGYVTKFQDEAIELGLATRNAKVAAKKGYVKMSSDMDASLAAHIDDEIFVDPDILELFGSVSAHVDEVAKIGGRAFESMLDEFTDSFKYAATQGRLGHHVRNYVGGLSMNHMAQGAKYYGKAHGDAWRIFNTIRPDINEPARLIDDIDILGKPTEGELDTLAAITRLDIPVSRNTKNKSKLEEVLHVGAKTKKNPEGIKLTVEEVKKQMTKLGALPKVAQAEAFATKEAAQTMVGKVTQKFLTFASGGLAARGGRVERMWSRVSEGQDHINRTHLILQYVYQALDGRAMTRGVGKRVKFDLNDPNVLDDIFYYAVERANKFHPTSNMLTAIERAVPRRLFPFYSWNKGAVIALTETAVMFPGRVTLPAKASYNIAVANGVDPNSFFDPFPTDQNFPSFMTEDITGPQFLVNGEYYSMAPGMAQLDVLNQFGASQNVFEPLGVAVANSLNPIFKLPVELMTGTRIGIGSKISDMSDFIDSSIPNVSYWANWTTYSPSSLLIDGELQKNVKYEKGIKDMRDRIDSFSNWALGWGRLRTGRQDFQDLANTEDQLRRAELREEGEE